MNRLRVRFYYSTVFLLGFRTFSKNFRTFSIFFPDKVNFNFRLLENKIRTISFFLLNELFLYFRRYPYLIWTNSFNVIQINTYKYFFLLLLLRSTRHNHLIIFVCTGNPQAILVYSLKLSFFSLFSMLLYSFFMVF
jgi:hypothetical protein